VRGATSAGLRAPAEGVMSRGAVRHRHLTKGALAGMQNMNLLFRFAGKQGLGADSAVAIELKDRS